MAWGKGKAPPSWGEERGRGMGEGRPGLVLPQDVADPEQANPMGGNDSRGTPVLLPIHAGRGKARRVVGHALVDDDLFPVLHKLSWHYVGKGYPGCWPGKPPSGHGDRPGQGEVVLSLFLVLQTPMPPLSSQSLLPGGKNGCPSDPFRLSMRLRLPSWTKAPRQKRITPTCGGFRPCAVARVEPLSIR